MAAQNIDSEVKTSQNITKCNKSKKIRKNVLFKQLPRLPIRRHDSPQTSQKGGRQGGGIKRICLFQGRLHTE